MASVRRQILLAVEAKLLAARDALGWSMLLVNPRTAVGEDQFNALVLAYGGDTEPTGLTGHVGQSEVEFSVALLVQETGSASAEDLLDQGFVKVSNTLLDPADIQLGQLAIGVRRGAISDPSIGRGQGSARIFGGQVIDFAVQYLEREGDAETPGP